MLLLRSLSLSLNERSLETRSCSFCILRRMQEDCKQRSPICAVGDFLHLSPCQPTCRRLSSLHYYRTEKAWLIQCLLCLAPPLCGFSARGRVALAKQGREGGKTVRKKINHCS